MQDKFIILGMNGNLFLAAVCMIMCVIDILLALNSFSHGNLYGIADFIFAIWFGFLSFVKWIEYRKEK